MTDYFALLDQPRRPWLDPDELKQAFHAKSRQFHPDTEHDAAGDAAFAEVNEAYQLLQDPKRRIHHLLELEGRAPGRQTAVPSDLADLFPIVAEATQQAEALMQKAEAASTPLSRSLLKPQLLATQNRTAEALQVLRQLHADATADARRLSTATADEELNWLELQHLYLRFSYLGRWLSELEEKQLRLQNT